MFHLIIVEDEAILRKGICKIIDWSGLGFQLEGDFSNAPEALSFLRENPVDLVVTDIKMPEMTGIELSEQIHVLYPEIKVIVLTAFSDFSLAVEALRAGVFDYVVKSEFVNRLPLSVRRVHTLLLEENNQRRSGSQAFSALTAGILSHTVTNDEDLSYWFHQMNIKPLDYMIAGFWLSQNPSLVDDEKEDSGQAKIFEFLKSSLTPYPTATSNVHTGLLLVFLYSDRHSPLPEIPFWGTSIAEAVETLFSCRLQVTYSEVYQELRDLPGALYECTQPEYKWDEKVPGPNGISSSDLVISNPADVTATFTKNICDADFDSCAGCLPYFIHELENRKFSFLKIKNILLNIFLLTCDKLCSPNWHMYQLDLLKETTLNDLKNTGSVSRLQEMLLEFARKSISIGVCCTDNVPAVILEINGYIRQNFKIPIRIDDISSALHMNSSYLSRVYKTYTGYSIIHTLNHYRIEHACVLLASGTHKITDIASMVGIDEPAYFTTVFTKYMGCSPSAYRNPEELTQED